MSDKRGEERKGGLNDAIQFSLVGGQVQQSVQRAGSRLTAYPVWMTAAAASGSFLGKTNDWPMAC